MKIGGEKMANGNIKGITIEIGGDTTGLTEALKDVNKESKKIQNELKEVEKALKLDPGNTELLRQKQELLTQSIQQTSQKLDTLRTAQQQVQQQFERGQINAEQYRAFNRELTQTEAALRGFEGQLNSMTSEQNRFADAQRRLETYMQATHQTADGLANVLGSRLASAIRDGTATADQMEVALQRIARQSGVTSQDLDRFNTVLRNAGNNSNLNGIRQELEQISDSAEEAEGSLKELGGTLSATVGGIAAGGGIAGTVATALDAAGLETKINISMEIPEESIEAVKQAVKNVTKYGVDAEEALEAVRRQWALNADATDEANARIVEGAGVISKAYAGIDLIELVQEVNEIGAALKISNEEAIGMVNTLLKTGFPPEQLDIIAEYGEQLKIAGYDAEQIQNIMSAAVDTKSWNIDNLLDGLKESKIGLSEFGLEIPKAMGELLSKTTISSKQMKAWGAAVAKGGEDGSQAMVEVAKALAEVDDATLRNELGVQVFGTKFEDQGMKLVETLMKAEQGTADLSEGVNTLNKDLETMNDDPMVKVKDALNNMMTQLSPLLTAVADFVGKIADWASENPVLTATLAAIATVVGILIGAFALLMPAIGAIISSWPVLVAGFGSIAAPILIAVGVIAGLGAAFVALWQNSETFRDNLTNVFNKIKEVAVTVFETVASFIGEKINQIKAFWDAEGAQILAAVENLFNGIKAVVEFVMPAIKLIIDMVWGAIKNIITGALDVIMGAIKVFSGLFTGDFSNMWEGIKQIFKGAIDVVIGFMTLTFVGGIRSLVTNFVKTIVNAFKGKWTSIVSLFKEGGTGAVNAVKTMATSAATAIKNFATNFVNSISSMATSVVGKFNDLKMSIISKVKEINLVQIGKDIINGLIKGITSMTTAVVDSITGVVDGVIGKAKSLLGIRSPSRVFKEIGLWTGEGMAIGLDNSSETVNKAMENIGDGILAVSNSFQKEYDDMINEFNKKNENKEDQILKKIQNIRNSAAKKKKALTKAQLQEIALLEASYLEQKETNEIAFDKKYKAMVEKSEKEYLEVIKNYIADKKSLEQMSLIDEAAIWEQSIELFVEGTNQRLQAQQNYKKSIEALNKEITSINSEFSGQVQKINEDLVKQEETLTKAYEDAVSKRAQSLYSFKNLFDEFKAEIDVTGEQLLANLGSQVEGFKVWQREIETLSQKAIDEGLLEELRQMGPNALPQLLALNQLTDKQLQQYSNLYKEKSKLARTQAETELIGMKNDTDKQITALRTSANKQLDTLQKDWNNKIKGITRATQYELATLESIGLDAGRGLLNGLSSMSDPLVRKAREIATSISRTIQEALDIHSPSRVMKGFGVNIGQGLIVGMDDMITKVSQSSARLANAVASAQGSLASSSAKSQHKGLSPSVSSSTINNSKYMQPSITIINQSPNASPSEIARKSLQAQRQLAMEWGV